MYRNTLLHKESYTKVPTSGLSFYWSCTLLERKLHAFSWPTTISRKIVCQDVYGQIGIPQRRVISLIYPHISLLRLDLWILKRRKRKEKGREQDFMISGLNMLFWKWLSCRTFYYLTWLFESDLKRGIYSNAPFCVCVLTYLLYVCACVCACKRV